MSTAVEIHRAEYGEPPKSLDELRELYGLHERELLDAWQRPITLSAADERFTLRSSGPDRMSGNADDIVIEDGYVIQGGPQPPD